MVEYFSVARCVVDFMVELKRPEPRLFFSTVMKVLAWFQFSNYINVQ